jgi:hypothetical protein
VARRTRRLAREASIGGPCRKYPVGGRQLTQLQTGMDKALVQQSVHQRINDRRLPLGSAVAIREMLGDGQPCDACEEPISPREKLVLAMVSLEWMSLRFHADCYQVWDAGRLALVSQPSSGSARDGNDICR